MFFWPSAEDSFFFPWSEMGYFRRQECDESPLREQSES